MPVPIRVADATERQLAEREVQLRRVTQRVQRHLDRLRDQVTGSLSDLDEAALTRQVSRLIDELSDLTQAFEQAATRDLVNEGEEAVAIGQDLIDVPLSSVSAGIAAPDVTLPLLEQVLGFAADRIRGLSGELVNQISSELRLGALGVKTPYEVIQEIAAKLRANDRGPSGRIADRAETITRTELGRIHSMSTQRRMEQALEQLPDLQKEWRHSGNIRNPRSGHQAVHGLRVPVRERFYVAPVIGASREWMLHPRDPAASARNVVRCRCSVVAWLARWED